MEPIYVFGHKNPDTDSVVSAMAYATLCNALGEGNYIPARLGHLNDETSFLLKRFDFEPPMELHTVATQVRDIEFDVPPMINRGVPISHASRTLMENSGLSALPVTTEDGKLFGMVTVGSIAEHDMDSISNPQVDNVPIFNLLSAVEGHIMNRDEDVFDSVSGRVIIALPRPENGIAPDYRGAVVICGEQPQVVEAALKQNASCVLLCETSLAERYMGIASGTCLVSTPFDAYRAARMLYQAIPVERIAKVNDLVYFHLDDYLDDVREKVLQSRFRSYPILDDEERVVGTLGRFHLLRPSRKRVVLVDHNEKAQSVAGLDQAEILAILDHHRLADVQTGSPVFMRNEPVGSTATIIATMFQERGLMPAPKLAGLMAAAILSDTVLFKSPTCTARDHRMAERLARIAGIDLDTLGKELFSAGKSFDKPASEIIATDFKEFNISSHQMGIGQITCVGTEDLEPRYPELLAAMEELRAAKHYDMVLVMLTDVLRVGTELLFTCDSEVIRNAFGLDDLEGNHVFLPRVVSRKKQIVPALAALWG